MDDKHDVGSGWLFRLSTTLGARQAVPAWPSAAAAAAEPEPAATAAAEPLPPLPPEPRR